MKSTITFCLAIILIIIVQNCSVSQQYWLRQSSPTNYLLSKCVFTDSLYGWAAGDSGAMVNTTNGGQNWTLQNTGLNISFFEDVFFLNRRLGWALSNDFFYLGTIIVKTTNGGETWTQSRFPDSTLILKTVFYTDSLHGYMGDQGGVIIRTTDAGNSWNRCSIDTSECFTLAIQKINFQNSATGYACGGHIDIVGLIWRTTNSGINWHPYCLSPEPMNDIKFKNGKVFGVGGDFEYGAMSVLSKNGGTAWSYDATGCFGVAQTISFRTLSEAWVPLGYSVTWMVSTDSGNSGSWFSLDAPENNPVYAVHFNSSTNGWAFGSGGAIFKYNTGVIGVSGTGSNLPSGYRLYQNYPNPFNPQTKIRFDLPKSAYVSIVIYDALGKELKSIYTAFSTAGSHEVSFDASGLSSGIYFYRIDAGNFKLSRKMVVLK